MTETTKKPRNNDLVPMTFTVEKMVKLGMDVMVHKDMLTETNYGSGYIARSWNDKRAYVPDDVRGYIIDHDDDFGDGESSDHVDSENAGNFSEISF